MFALLIRSLDSPTDKVEPNDPHTSDLLVSCMIVLNNITSVNLAQLE